MPGIKFHRDGSVPQSGEVFVFGSNTAGRHGKGSALLARQQFGARMGFGKGYMTGPNPGEHCYALPTKNSHLYPLSLYEISKHIRDFYFDITRTDLADKQLFITRIGCGLAGYSDNDIAPMFRNFPENCSFPDTWRPWLETKENT